MVVSTKKKTLINKKLLKWRRSLLYLKLCEKDMKGSL